MSQHLDTAAVIDLAAAFMEDHEAQFGNMSYATLQATRAPKVGNKSVFANNGLAGGPGGR